MKDRKKRQQSSIDLLPDEVRQLLQEMLRDRKLTQLEAVRRLNAALATMQAAGQLPPEAPAAVSKSAVNRYYLDMEAAGAKLRQSREVAEMWIGKLGTAPQGQVGDLVNEILRTLSFDMALLLQRDTINVDDAPATVDMLKGLALTMQRLEQAANLNVKRTAEIRKQAQEAALKLAASAAVTAVKSIRGATDAQIEQIRADILGVEIK